MMRWIFFLTVLLVGCGQQNAPFVADKGPSGAITIVPKPVPEPTDAEKIALLRAEAHKRGMRWRIWCIWWEEKDDFQAVAWRGHGPEPNLGEADLWMVSKPTQADAAYQMYFDIQGFPSHPAEEYRKHEERKQQILKHKVCPPELRGQ
jgi:hypothetical protein